MALAHAKCHSPFELLNPLLTFKSCDNILPLKVFLLERHGGLLAHIHKLLGITLACAMQKFSIQMLQIEKFNHKCFQMLNVHNFSPLVNFDTTIFKAPMTFSFVHSTLCLKIALKFHPHRECYLKSLANCTY